MNMMATERPYMPIHVWRSVLDWTEPWIMQCDICSAFDRFDQWRHALSAADTCRRTHLANQCPHCGRTS